MIIFKNGIYFLLYSNRSLYFRQKAMFTSYQSQAALFNRLKNEMIGLYAKVWTRIGEYRSKNFAYRSVRKNKRLLHWIENDFFLRKKMLHWVRSFPNESSLDIFHRIKIIFRWSSSNNWTIRNPSHDSRNGENLPLKREITHRTNVSSHGRWL